jgi:glyoxylase-like metal-dependent hydrolase (beta-lactamase superfamily II)
VVLEHHAGPSNGSIWARLPEEKVVFVGDAVLKNQPPFLAGSNLTEWLSALNLLLGSSFKGYTIISGRGGVVTANNVKSQLDFIKHVSDKMDKLKSKKPNPATIEKMVNSLLAWFKAPAARQKQFAQRLRYGLLHYNSRPSHISGQFIENQ